MARLLHFDRSLVIKVFVGGLLLATICLIGAVAHEGGHVITAAALATHFNGLASFLASKSIRRFDGRAGTSTSLGSTLARRQYHGSRASAFSWEVG